MPAYKGVAEISVEYFVEAEDKDHANDAILDLACEEFPEADVRVYNSKITEI